MNEKLEGFIGIWLAVLYVFAILAFAFDFGVTYYMFNQDKEGFIYAEQNQFLVGHLEDGRNFWTEEFIFIQMIVLLFSLFIFRKITSLNFDDRFKYLINVVSTSLYIYFIVVHIDGGLSWL